MHELQAIPEKIQRFNDALDQLGGTLRCTKCDKTIAVTSASQYVQEGWPTCCDHAMTYTTKLHAAEEPEEDPEDDDTDEEEELLKGR